MSPEFQAFAVISWLAAIKIFQMGVWPLIRRSFGEISYGAAYPAAVLLFALFSWYCGLAGLPIQVAAIPFIILVGYYLKNRCFTVEEVGKNVVWDGVFLAGFMFMLEVRFLNPTISFAEKFMDHAFLASIMRNPVIPPIDPWYAGGFLDMYYYLGHWVMGSLGLVCSIPSSVVFNLILPTVFGLTAVGLFGIGHLLIRQYRWLPLLTLFLPNVHFIILALSGASVHTVMWESTRTITDAITEFPLFSMLWGDPHAHVISLFNQVFLLLVLVYMLKRWHALPSRSRTVVSACAALSLGSMPLINSWDVLIYAPIVILFGLIIWRQTDGIHIHTAPWQILLGIPALSIALFLPYYAQLHTQGIRGIGIVPGGTDPVQFLLVHGIFLALLYVYIRSDIRNRPYLLLAAVPFVLTGYFAAALVVIPLIALFTRKKTSATDLLAMLGLAIICLVEILYLMDNMGETYFRMNTVFKFTLPAWIFLGVSTSSIVGGWLKKYTHGKTVFPRPVRMCVAVIVLILLILPLVLPDLSYGYGSGTLDGLAYLEGTHPGDAAGVAYLRSVPGDIRIIEAEGGDYDYYSRISSFTGIPTVIGMPFHEQMWRGDEGDIGQRMADVRAIYEDPARSPGLLATYGIDFVYVGPPERERYDVNLPVDALESVYTGYDIEIYRVENALSDEP